MRKQLYEMQQGGNNPKFVDKLLTPRELRLLAKDRTYPYSQSGLSLRKV